MRHNQQAMAKLRESVRCECAAVHTVAQKGNNWQKSGGGRKLATCKLDRETRENRESREIISRERERERISGIRLAAAAATEDSNWPMKGRE